MINELGLEYAKALLSLPLAKEEAMYALNILNEIIKDPEVFHVIMHPSIAKDDKKAIFNNVFKERIDSSFIHFIYVLIDNERINDMQDIYDSFNYLAALEDGILNVEIISNHDLTNEQLANIFKFLKNKYQKNVIKHTFTLDQTLMGGIKIKVGNDLIDASLDDQLLKLKESLM